MDILNVDQLFELRKLGSSLNEYEHSCFEDTMDKLMYLGFGDTDEQVFDKLKNLMGHRIRIVNRWRTDKRAFKIIAENTWFFGDLSYQPR